MNKTQIPCVDTETIKHFHQNVNDISISTPQARWHATVLTSGYRNWLLLQRICSFQAGLRSLDPVQTSDQQVQAWSCHLAIVLAVVTALEGRLAQPVSCQTHTSQQSHYTIKNTCYYRHNSIWFRNSGLITRCIILLNLQKADFHLHCLTKSICSDKEISKRTQTL